MCIGFPHYHPLIVGTLDLLPDWHHGATWTAEGVADWLELLERNLRALYTIEPPVPPTPGPFAAGPNVRVVEMPAGVTVAVGTDGDVWATGDRDLVEPLGIPGTMRIGPAADGAAAALAARLEAELHPSVEDLEAEAMRPTPPPPSSNGNGKRLLSDGGHYNRAGQYADRLPCTFPTRNAEGRCGLRCSGENGLRGHLARGHGLTGEDNGPERDRLVAEAIALADAAEKARLEAPDPPTGPPRFEGPAPVAGAELDGPERRGTVIERTPAPAPAEDLDAVEEAWQDEEERLGAHRPPEPEPEPVGPVDELRAAAETSPGAARLLEMRRLYLNRVTPRTHKLDRFAVADELGVSHMTTERWLAEAYPNGAELDPATLETPAGTDTTPERS